MNVACCAHVYDSAAASAKRLRIGCAPGDLDNTASCRVQVRPVSVLLWRSRQHVMEEDPSQQVAATEAAHV